ncbi:NAD(P)H-dependent oxidoreductase [Streptomyces sp. NBC_01387]|uniref:NADPH-dependent FMN reductase n=1 Tax=unclassified Streptomyces TaxID=2593676 RepID=UPI002025ACED|nr:MULTISPECIES: NAD(P)H-dependent oxidoreductase [unclassified Streptomyces]MCX4551261.1 NAD(P)H-dependent oxidoreductase [Streptomyces sp. NBC_01500]WSC22655.1 NAD(P)H-dependent oxidoreductase [Streptomyces sp. NBC_01766]WSV56499.1 NAD(P)H-dependent oxidoreductase [Streptomyces sp. NBC_01014]
MDLTTHPLNLAVIIASNRSGRFAGTVADWFLAHADRPDLTVDVVDLAETDLPTALSSEPSPDVRDVLGRISPKLGAADAFVVLTPEYNHSFPASLKSLIDWHFTEWQAKPVAFVSYGGVSGGLRAVEQLRQVFAEMHAVTVRDTVSFHHAHGHFDEDGTHKNPEAADAAAGVMLDQLVWWAHALRDAKAVRPYGG